MHRISYNITFETEEFTLFRSAQLKMEWHTQLDYFGLAYSPPLIAAEDVAARWMIVTVKCGAHTLALSKPPSAVSTGTLATLM